MSSRCTGHVHACKVDLPCFFVCHLGPFACIAGLARGSYIKECNGRQQLTLAAQPSAPALLSPAASRRFGTSFSLAAAPATESCKWRRAPLMMALHITRSCQRTTVDTMGRLSLQTFKVPWLLLRIRRPPRSFRSFGAQAGMLLPVCPTLLCRFATVGFNRPWMSSDSARHAQIQHLSGSAPWLIRLSVKARVQEPPSRSVSAFRLIRRIIQFVSPNRDKSCSAASSLAATDKRQQLYCAGHFGERSLLRGGEHAIPEAKGFHQNPVPQQLKCRWRSHAGGSCLLHFAK